jgi:hypothetical protein
MMDWKQTSSVFTCTDTVGWQVGYSVVSEGWNSQVVNNYSSAAENRASKIESVSIVLRY